MGVLAQLLEVYVTRHPHVPRLDLEDLDAPRVVRHSNVQLPVEAAEPAEGLGDWYMLVDENTLVAIG